jgi:hypothetical protein
MEVANAPTKTRRKLGMHEKLLFDTIQRQAGTLEKANVEGVMNSIEAGGSAVYITLTADGQAIMNIHDDGRGIQNETEVQEFFETFGTPHTDVENTTWKQFRMGRGQMFAYGKNIWRTATFRMTVDIKNWGLEYEFESGLEFVEGCDITIELYNNPIGGYPYYSMDTYKEAIQQQVRFVEPPVLFNNEQINTDPKDCTWDKKDAFGYYLFNVGTDLLIYNLGVFVQKIPASKAGMGGIVVSRQQLRVNFARNDVISDCEVMQHINNVIRDNRIKRTRQTRRTLNSWERQATMSDLRDGQQDLADVKTLALIRTAQGKHVSLDFIRKNRQQWCFAPCGSDLADRLMEREQAICLDEALLTDLNYTGHKSGFFSWLTGIDTQYSYGTDDWKAVERMYTDFDKLSEDISDSYCTLPDKKLSVVERRIIKVLNSYCCWRGRVINLGYSERANAWTNGSSYITIDRSFLKRLSVTWARHCNKLMTLLAHEMAHDSDTRGTHVHGPEFYENMCRILRSDDAPTIHNCDFRERMEKSKVDEKQAKLLAKEAKAEAKVVKKLGIAASSK